jgi:putative ABC transport system ATP-binding protein
VLEALESINREFGTTVLVITHNIAVGAMADRVIHFADGRVARIEENETREAPASIAW